MGRRASSGGSGKRSRKERAPHLDTPAFQRRVDRHHGGPPAHIIARQQAELVRRRERAAARQATEAARAAANAELIEIPVALAAAVVPAGAHTPAPIASVPVIVPPPAVIVASQQRAATSRRRVVLNSVFGGVAAAALAAAAAAYFIPANHSTPPISRPTSMATMPLMSPHVIERRIVEMTPPLRYAAPSPALPGSIRFAALSLPAHAPYVPSDLAVSPAPVVVPPAPFALALAVPTVETPPPLMPPVTAPIEIAPVEPSPTTIGNVDAPAQCRPASDVVEAAETPSREDFGPALAAAAAKQLDRFIVYDARYTRIAYPGGDVGIIHGVCTDVIIRAYRALGVDLQRLVQVARVGVGDTSIDHRRTETLRKFLATQGESLPVTDDPEDYRPGDIVTYYRPQNRISTAHIAIVSDVIAPSGRPMIIHNRGFGVQLEDALFVDRITGRYRYAGPTAPLPPLPIAAAKPAPVASSAQVTAQARAAAVVRAAAKSPAAQKLWERHAQGDRPATAPSAR